MFMSLLLISSLSLASDEPKGHISISKLSVSPPTGRVYIDGNLMGSPPLQSITLTPGPHDLKIESDCHQMHHERLLLPVGVAHSLDYELKPLLVDMSVRSLNHLGQSVSADAYVDNERIGRTPLNAKISICAKKLRLERKLDGRLDSIESVLQLDRNQENQLVLSFSEIKKESISTKPTSTPPVSMALLSVGYQQSHHVLNNASLYLNNGPLRVAVGNGLLEHDDIDLYADPYFNGHVLHGLQASLGFIYADYFLTRVEIEGGSRQDSVFIELDQQSGVYAERPSWLQFTFFNGIVAPFTTLRPYGGLSIIFGSYQMDLPDHVFTAEEYANAYDFEEDDYDEPEGPSLLNRFLGIAVQGGVLLTLPQFHSGQQWGIEWQGKVGVNTEGRHWQQGVHLVFLAK